MTHSTDEDLLVLHWDGSPRTARHVDTCGACRERLADLRELLKAIDTTPMPERDESYGRDVWARVAPRLPDGPPRRSPVALGWRPVVLAGAMAAAIVGAFLVGRAGRPKPAPPGSSVEARQRVLLFALGEHLDRSEAVLLELVRAPGEGELDVSAEQTRLSDLLPANRLYRQAARSNGEPGVSSVLDELERVLLDVRHGPARLSSTERAALVQRIESDGVLFKVRILGARVRERTHAAPPSSPIIERKRV